MRVGYRNGWSGSRSAENDPSRVTRSSGVSWPGQVPVSLAPVVSAVGMRNKVRAMPAAIRVMVDHGRRQVRNLNVRQDALPWTCVVTDSCTSPASVAVTRSRFATAAQDRRHQCTDVDEVVTGVVDPVIAERRVRHRGDQAGPEVPQAGAVLGGRTHIDWS